MVGNRLIWIDWAKTIGIFLVILGHVPISADIKWWIYGMHMPLFFLISGYLKSSASGKEGRERAIKKILNGLLIPYLIYCTAITLLYVALKGGSTIVPNILVANYAALVSDYTSICPLWFLVSLITIKVIDLFVENAPPRLPYKCLIFTTIAIVISYIQMPNYFMLKTTVLCLPFYYIGFYIKEKRFMTEGEGVSRIPLPVFIGGFIISLVFSYINGTVYLTTCDVGKSYILFLMSSILGSICLFGILQRLTKKSFSLVEMISEGTLLIMSVHYLMIKPIIALIPSSNVFYWLVDSFIILTITICLIIIAKRYCPVLLGKQKIIK